EGEIDWEWIVQEGRAIEGPPTWDDPAAYARAVQRSHRRNKWAGQPRHVLVVSEKGTVRGTLRPVLDEFEVEFLPVGGYASATRVRDLVQYAKRGSRSTCSISGTTIRPGAACRIRICRVGWLAMRATTRPTRSAGQMTWSP